LSALRERFLVAQRKIRSVRGEIFVSVAGTVGWVFITASIAQVVRPDVVWRASAGIFLLSLCGWKLLYEIASSGLYILTRSRRG
jgi:hypothetical protein